MRKHSYSKYFVKHVQQIIFYIPRKVRGMSNLKMLIKVHSFDRVQKYFDVITSDTFFCNCHNPNDNTTQHNLNTVVGLDTKMTQIFLGLGLVIETQTFSVLVSVSLLRLRPFQS